MPISHLFAGSNIIGTAEDDFIFSSPVANPGANQMFGLDGDDLIIGDISNWWTVFAGVTNNTIGTAVDINDSLRWFTEDNPLFADAGVAHTTVLAEATAGQAEYYRFNATAGAIATIDIDFGAHPIGVTADLAITLFNSEGVAIASNDDSAILNGGIGSINEFDSYLRTSALSAGTYYVRVSRFSGSFTGGESFLLNLSVTGHASSAAAAMGDDAIDGGNGADTLIGAGGNDTITGGADDDLIHAGTGTNTVSAGSGADAIYLLGPGDYNGDEDDDRFFVFGQFNNLSLNGGAGVDSLDLTSAGLFTMTINLATGGTSFSFNSTFANFENVTTGGTADTITGTDAANIIRTGEGEDQVNGGAGDDEIDAGPGTNNVSGGSGNDLINVRGPGVYSGGEGDDSFPVSGQFSGISLDGGSGMDSLILEFDSGFAINLVTGAASYSPNTTFTNFENLRALGSNITVTGTDAANIIRVGAGTNQVDAGGGDDLVQSGAGADTLNGGAGNDTIDYSASAAGVAITLSLDYAAGGDADGDVISGFENAIGSNLADFLVGTEYGNVLGGNAGADRMDGGGGDDLLDGGSGNDRLVGGGGNDLIDGGTGADVMSGGSGDDLYTVDVAGDVVAEGAGEGVDEIRTALASYSIAALVNVENLTGTAAAGQSLTGNAGINLLTGGAGSDMLDGGGGADVHSGLGGNDFYIVDDTGDSIIEAAGGGQDYVGARISYALAAGVHVETLSALEQGGLAVLSLTGNAFSQDLIGNFGANILVGGGGADRLIGLAGDDFYIVDSADDLVIEYAGDGRDYVAASVSYTLAGGAEVETLSALEQGGTAALNLTGNALGQDLIGNNGSNVLNGGGGTDRLIGLGGDDFYVIDSADDSIIEFAGGGVDYVYARASWTLSAGAEVETVSTESHAATDAIDLNGNELANTMIGNNGANILNGRGGADRLVGLGGADAFVFNTALGGGNVDQILDMTVGVDEIILDDAVFAGLALGALSAGAFNTGSSAQDADDRILYDAASGALFFDADGAGGAAAVQFASVAAGLAITANEFTVI